MKRSIVSLAVAALCLGGCQSAYNNAYDAEMARLEAQQRAREQQEAAQREAQRQELMKYVAIVLFKVGSAEIDDAGRHELDWFLDKIAGAPFVEIEVKGYTDSTGSEATNVPLSNKRAWAAQDYLVSQGIAAQRITASGFGATDPARPNVTPDGRIQNRRAEVRVR